MYHHVVVEAVLRSAQVVLAITQSNFLLVYVVYSKLVHVTLPSALLSALFVELMQRNSFVFAIQTPLQTLYDSSVGILYRCLRTYPLDRVCESWFLVTPFKTVLQFCRELATLGSHLGLSRRTMNTDWLEEVKAMLQEGK